MKALERRLARLEVRSHAREEALVSPETLQRMASIAEAECARVRETLFADGPHVAAPIQPGVESEARARLCEKLLRDDSPPAESART